MMLTDFLHAHWGDLAGVFGLLVSIVGFALTLWNVTKSKTAAQNAKAAVDEVRERIRSLDTLADLTQSVAIMDEIKRLQRAGAWHVVLDRYTTLRRFLIQTHAQHPHLLAEQKAVLTGAIRQVSEIEKKVERSIQRDDCAKTDVAKLNEVISHQVDQLSQVLAQLQHAMGA